MSASAEALKQPTDPARFVEWVYETFQDQLHLDEVEGSRKFQAFLKSMNIETFPLSGARRVQSFHIIKFGYPMRRAGYVTAVFSVKTHKHEAYIAYAYWSRDSLGKENPQPEYICVSPTFVSCDGEYRHRFLWYPEFAKGYSKVSDLVGPLESSLLELIQDDEIRIDVSVYPSEMSEIIVPSIEKERLGIKTLVAILSVDAFRASKITLQKHVSENYFAVVDYLNKKVSPTINEWSEADRKRLSVFTTGKKNSPHRTQCGQKLMPLTVRESLQVNDVNFAPWREVWVDRRVTDLVVNGVAPMFPIFGNWTYLSGADEYLFENQPMRTKYERSQKAEVVADSLRKARDLIGAERDTDYRMSQLDSHIHDSALYAQEFLILTELALCKTSEFVGSTLHSIPSIIRNSKRVSPVFTRIFSDETMVSRYLFDLCYGVHQLHTRMEVIHSDLHLGNMTMYELGSRYTGVSTDPDVPDFRDLYENPVISYVMAAEDGKGKESSTYVFPHDGWFACLIDFSRALLGPEARQSLVDESGEAFATGFYRNQVSRVLRTIHHYIPGFAEKNQERIKSLILGDYGRLFKAITAVDFLAIGRNFGALLKQQAAAPKEGKELRTIEVSQEGIRIAETLEKRALEHLIVHMTDLTDPKSRDSGEIGFAGETIIPSVFERFLYRPENVSDSTLVAVYNGAAPLKYSSNDYSQFPPWAKFDDLEQHLSGLKIGAVTADRGTRPFLQTLDLDGCFAILQEEVCAKISDTPSAAATSSWLPE